MAASIISAYSNVSKAKRLLRACETGMHADVRRMLSSSSFLPSWASSYFGIDLFDKTYFDGESSALHISARTGNQLLAVIILEAIPDPKRRLEFILLPDANKKTVVHLSCMSSHLFLQKVLEEFDKCRALVPDADVTLATTDMQGYTPLHLAAKLGMMNCFQMLILRPEFRDPSVINFIDHDGSTLLHFAAREYSGRLLDMLAEFEGIFTLANHVNNNSYTALHFAAMACTHADRPTSNIRNLLIGSGRRLGFSAVNIISINQRTPLHLIARHNSVPGAINELVSLSGHEAGFSNFNQLDKDGLSALHTAVLRRDVSAVRELLYDRAGITLVDPNVKSG